jgi:4-hydroxy-3-methylbut-2-en-1-yl diphosphate reductase
VEIPYLHLGENDFIYKFRPAQERNTAIYAQDSAASALYQSQLCAAIKALARQHERTAAAPITLDFGAVRYVIPVTLVFAWA